MQGLAAVVAQATPHLLVLLLFLLALQLLLMLLLLLLQLLPLPLLLHRSCLRLGGRLRLHLSASIRARLLALLRCCRRVPHGCGRPS
jgi:hypothetical protein